MATSFEIQHFITYLSRYRLLSISSVRCYLSSIGFHIKLHSNNDPTKSFAISRLLKTYSQLSKPIKTRKPIDYTLLLKLCDFISNSNISPYYKHCYITMYNLMYHAALRISEVSISSTDQHILLLNSILIDYDKHTISIHFISYKHSDDDCPVLVIHCDKLLENSFKQYLNLRSMHTGPFFCHSDHTPFRRKEIADMLDSHLKSIHYDSSKYNTHSFRIGKATDMSQNGFSELEIKQLGRWKSDAYKSYLKPHTIHSKLGHI